MENKNKTDKVMEVRSGSEIKKYDEPRLPGKWLYYPAAALLKTYVRLMYQVKFDKSALRELKEKYGDKTPYVVLSNHCSTLDWIYVASDFLPDMLNFVVTTHFFSKPGLRGLLKTAGAIPKDQFSPDVHSVKTILKTAKLGGNIMVFPEGRMSPSGMSETFERSTVKLLKHLKNPVIAVKLNGAYLTNPKWSKIRRKGRIEIATQILFTPKQLDSLSEEELYDRMCDALCTDDFAWQRKNYVQYKTKKFAQGLENVLWKCPKCLSEFSHTTRNFSITCSKCGNKVRMNDYYEFFPARSAICYDNIAQWYNWEVEEIKKDIEKDDTISMSGHMTLSQIINTRKWLEPVGDGVGTIDKTGFSFSGKRLGEDYELFVPINMLPAAAVDPGKSFELYYKGELFSFSPDDPVTTQKWSSFIEQMHDHVCGE